MPIYRFKAVDATGSEVTDSINAHSVEEAARMIRQLGYFVTMISEVAPAQKAREDTHLPRQDEIRNDLESLIEIQDAATGPHADEDSEFELSLDEADLTSAAPREERQEGGERRLGEVLVDLGFVDEDQLWEVLDEARRTGQQTGQVALSRGLITEEQLYAALAERHGLQLVNLEETRPQPDALVLVPPTLYEVYKMLPLSIKDNVLTVAIGDPTKLASLNDLRNIVGKEVQAVLATPRAIAEAQARAHGGKEESIIDLINSLEADLPREDENSIDLEESLMEIQDAAPVRKLVNMVMLLAIRDRASDIHFEPFEDEYKLRYRCDGMLMELVPPPRHIAPAIADRIKVMANLDLAERGLPQHGRIDLNVGGNPMPMRVSVLPTPFGESVAIRVCDATAVPLDLNKFGIDPQTLHLFRQLIHEPSGIILVTGPSGAGKTTTLYAALNELNQITGKIITVEDPVEYEIDGIVQCPIRRDLTFADTLRPILGQNPDIIVVGAIRDPETAHTALEAALSGRMVLSTLNANDAASSITQLRSMGLEPSLIAATVKGILAQRLVRKICEDCRTEFEPSNDVLRELNLRPEDVQGKKFYYGRGCDRCFNTGHRGRMGLFELLVVNDHLRDTVCAGVSTHQLRQACHQLDMLTLRASGLRALFEGKTTIEEVTRETIVHDEG